MKIGEARIFRYVLPLIQPLTTHKEQIRTGLILELKSATKQIAYAEIAPLPGLHLESLENAADQLQEFLFYVFKHDWVEEDIWQGIELGKSLFPSVQMGIDLALLQLFSKEKGVPFYRYLGVTNPVVRLRALIDPIYDLDVVSSALSFVRQGYQSIKVKIGRLPYEKEAQMLKNLRDTVGPIIELCLDANQAYTLEQAIELGRVCARQKISHVEEPLLFPHQIMDFYRATLVPVALDETWLKLSFESLIVMKEAFYGLVIKPGLIGGMCRLKDILSFMKIWGIKPVFTSAFESGLALSLWTYLAAFTNEQEVAHGFGTFMWLKEDLFTPPFRAFRGQIDIVQMEKNLAAFCIKESSNCQLLGHFRAFDF